MLTLALIIGLVVGIVWYLHYRLTYWQRKSVPTPGLVYQWNYYTRQLPLYDLELTKKLGPIYGVMEGLTPILIISDLELMKDVLVKDFNSFPNHKTFKAGDPRIDLNLFSLHGGEDWKRIRSLLSPAFTSGKLRSMEGLVNDCVDCFKKNLRVAADSGAVIDAKKYFSSLAFDTLSRCAYGAQVDTFADPKNPLLNVFEKVFTMSWELFVTMMFPKFAKVTGIDKRALRPAEPFFMMTKAMIDERTQASKSKSNANGGSKHNDFLQIMIDANQEAMNEAAENEGRDVQSQTHLKKTLSTDEMMAQAITFLLAGFDTTATIMGACAYHLAKNPDVQDKLIAEVSNLREFTHDSVMSLKYMDAFIKESLRHSPSLIRVERECTQPTLIGNIKVEPKTMVSIPVYAVHRDPSQYKDPEKFDPQRFIDGDSVNHHPYAYLPFGAGPRGCMAPRFALMELKLAFASVLQEYRFESTPETKLEFTPGSIDTLAPKPIMVKVRRH